MCFRNGASITVARRKSPQGNRLVLLLLLIVSFAATALVAGCSGSSSSGTPGVVTTPTPVATPTPAVSVTAKAEIAWGTRTRAFSASGSGYAPAPASALSAVITLTLATGGNLTATANRTTTNLAAYTGTYNLGPGTTYAGATGTLSVVFYANANATGSVVGTATSAVGVAVNTDGTLNTIVTTTGTINSVVVDDVALIVNGTAVPQNGTLSVNPTTPADVLYSCYTGSNGSGSLVAVTPGSGVLTVVSGSTTIQAHGDEVTPIAPTTGATFTITVDSVTSPAFTVKVISGTKITLAAALVGNSTIVQGGSSTAPIDSEGIPLTVNAAVAGDPTASGVTWSLQEGATAGTITTTTTSAVYTPPTTIPAAPVTYHLVATSIYDPNVTATLPIVVEDLVTIGVTPSTANISIVSTQQFNASLINIPTGSASTVTWSVEEGTGGTITSSGLYTAPATPGTYHVIATSVFDPSKSTTVPVTVGSFVKIAVTPNPTSTISIESTQQFAATVTGVPTGQSTAVTWSVQESAGGSIDSTGLYTSPATPGTYHIIATSVFEPSVSVTVPITVASFVSIAVVPDPPALLSIDSTQQFTATVAGVAAGGSTAVTWSIKEGATGGTISSSGLYTAPASVSNPAGTVFHVIATSVFDPTKSTTVPVTVGSGNLGIGIN